MSFIYTLIARANKIILTDYTEYSGNFQQISIIILDRIKKDKKCSIDYDDYSFHYDDEDEVTFMCMTRNISDATAFSFLADLKKRFLKKYELKTVKSTYAFGLREFGEELKSLVKFYEDNPTHSKSETLLNNLNDTATVLRESVEKLLERGEKLNIIAQKSKNLRNTSEDMKTIVIKI